MRIKLNNNNTTSIRLLCIAFGALTLTSQPLLSQAFYLDAEPGVTGNTVRASDGNPDAWWTTTLAADTLWGERAFGFGDDGTLTGPDREIFEATGNVAAGGGEDAVTLVTTISGLTPGRAYEVEVVYWSAGGQNWTIRAGFSLTNMTLFDRTGTTSNNATAGTATGVTEGDRQELRGAIGTAVADGSGQIKVYVDDLSPGNSFNDRSWYDGLFVVSDPTVGPTVITPPIVPVGGSAQATAQVNGTQPFSFQWLSNNVPILNATNQVLNLSNLQLADSGNAYRVVVSNNPVGTPVVVTNAAATLTVRTPISLVWGAAGFEWNTSDINWDSNSDGLADTAYTDADRVRFDDTGSSFVTLATNFYPSLVVVSNESVPYTLSVFGSISGPTALIKQGAALLSLDMDNTYSGGTLIGGGGIQVGTGANAGSVGTGPVTNNAGLTIDRTGAFSIPGNISGPGSITKNNTGTVTVSGTNSYSGATIVNGGSLILANNNALGNTPSITVSSTTGGASGGTRITLSGGITLPAVPLSLPSTFDTVRSVLFSTGTAGSTNTWTGPVTLNGNGNIAFAGDGGTFFMITGNVSGPAFDGSQTNALQLRGVSGLISGTMNLPIGNVLVTDNVTWTIKPPTAGGNTWSNTFLAQGTLRCGTNNALPTTTTVTFGQTNSSGILDLGGFNQTIKSLLVSIGSGAIGSVQFVTNSSSSADSTLTLSGGSSMFGGILAQGTRKLNLTVASGILQLTNAAALSLSNSTVSVASGAVLQLDAAVTFTVGSFVTNGISLPPGLYNNGNSAPFLTGAGGLLVASAGPFGPALLTNSVSGGVLSLSWPAQGWKLQMQTNSLSVGLSTNWTYITDGSVTATNITIDQTKPTLFYRLIYP